MWWWQGWDVQVGARRLGENVWRMIWMSWVCTLNGWCSEICEEASYREKRLTLAEHGRNKHFKNKWWWWWLWIVDPGIPSLSPEWVNILKAQSTAQGYPNPSLHLFVVVHWVPVLLNIKTATGCESNRQLQLWTVFAATVVYITSNSQHSRMGWAVLHLAPVSNKMSGFHLANAWRSCSKHILSFPRYAKSSHFDKKNYVFEYSAKTNLWVMLTIISLTKNTLNNCIKSLKYMQGNATDMYSVTWQKSEN